MQNDLFGSAEVLPAREVIAVDAWVSDDKLRASLETDGADNVKRVKTHDEAQARWTGRAGEGVSYIERFLETKTVWHPVGI